MDDNNNDNNNLQYESLLFRGTFTLLYQDPDFDIVIIVHKAYSPLHSHVLPFPSIPAAPDMAPGPAHLILNECKILSKFL